MYEPWHFPVCRKEAARILWTRLCYEEFVSLYNTKYILPGGAARKDMKKAALMLLVVYY
jgi:hypothetical protein